MNEGKNQMGKRKAKQYTTCFIVSIYQVNRHIFKTCNFAVILKVTMYKLGGFAGTDLNKLYGKPSETDNCRL